jgi:hypothetical protein
MIPRRAARGRAGSDRYGERENGNQYSITDEGMHRALKFGVNSVKGKHQAYFGPEACGHFQKPTYTVK